MTIHETDQKHNVRKPSAITIARDYVRRGWKPVPVPVNKKNPTTTEWQKTEITLANVEQHFNRWKNIGVQFGQVSGGLVDVDLLRRERMPSNAFTALILSSFCRSMSTLKPSCSSWIARPCSTKSSTRAMTL